MVTLADFNLQVMMGHQGEDLGGQIGVVNGMKEIMEVWIVKKNIKVLIRSRVLQLPDGFSKIIISIVDNSIAPISLNSITSRLYLL